MCQSKGNQNEKIFFNKEKIENVLPKELLNLPASKYIAEQLGSEGIEQSSEILAEILEKSGFNMNLAPVVVLDRFKENKVIGDRSFGKNFEDVSKYGLIQMNEYKKRKINLC